MWRARGPLSRLLTQGSAGCQPPAHPRGGGKKRAFLPCSCMERVYLVFISLLSSPCIYKFSIKSACLSVSYVLCLSLSDRATHALTASPSPPADEWKFPVKRAAAHSEWGGWGGGGRRGLCSLAVQRRQAFLKRRNRSKWAPLPRLHGLSLPDSGFPEAVDCWPSNHPRHGKAPVSSDICWVSYIWKTTKPAAERLHILGHCHRKRERDQNSPALRPRHEAPTCKNGVRVLAWAWCWQQSTRTGKR